LTFNATNKTVEVAKVGNYKLTATANGITKNVWVVVKTEQQDKFYLVNMPKIDEETFVVNDWRLVSNYNDTDLTVQDVIDEGDIEFVDNGIKIYKNFTSHKVGGALIYANEIFKDFADYTVETYSKNETPPTLVDAGNGAVGRVTLNEKETGWVTGIMSYIRNNRQVSISRTNGVDDFGGFTDAGELGLWTEAHHSVKTVFDGSKVLFYLNDTLMLDSTTNATYAQRVVTHHDGAGYPGMLAYGANSVFDQFYVYLNSTEMPTAQKVTPPAPTPDQDPTPDPTPDQDPTPGTKPSKPNSPQTGDNTNLALWAALLFVSGLGIFAITLFGRNKREEN
ncbi:MAG: LPXTG cell wall anchor domain-containing protein, partial [Clostridia bacterium]|nr:LPXTG cell wall anchor domain-containing protein [Clostridia bacterium]